MWRCLLWHATCWHHTSCIYMTQLSRYGNDEKRPPATTSIEPHPVSGAFALTFSLDNVALCRVNSAGFTCKYTFRTYKKSCDWRIAHVRHSAVCKKTLGRWLKTYWCHQQRPATWRPKNNTATNGKRMKQNASTSWKQHSISLTLYLITRKRASVPVVKSTQLGELWHKQISRFQDAKIKRRLL